MEIYNTNVSSILLDSLKETTSTQKTANSQRKSINKIVSNPISTCTVNNTEEDTANISSSAIDNFKYESQGNVISGLDLIQETWNALDEMEKNLAFLRSALDDSENYGDEFGLYAWLEEQSDAIIDQILDIYNNTEYNGVKIFSGMQEYSSTAMLDNYQNFVFSLGTQDDINAQLIINTQIDLEALREIKGISIYDDDYETNIDKIIAEINAKREELAAKKEQFEATAQTIYKEDDDESINSETVVVTSEDMLKQIVNNADSTIKSVTEGLNPDTILQFLNK